MGRTGFIGSGNMAEALIKGILAAKVCGPEDIFISDVRAERLSLLAEQYKVQAARDNKELAGKVDTLILSVKPQNAKEVLEEIRDCLKKNTLVISIAAGVTTANIARILGDVAIIRVMPNTPALVGEAASALFANEKGAGRLEVGLKLFGAVGVAVVVDDEGLMDAVTAVSGSGPAYYFLLMEEMIKAATESGLSEDVAKELVLQTAKGAAVLGLEAQRKGRSPAGLRKKVTSPGGTTEAALRILTQGGFGALVNKAIKRAEERSRELSG